MRNRTGSLFNQWFILVLPDLRVQGSDRKLNTLILSIRLELFFKVVPLYQHVVTEVTRLVDISCPCTFPVEAFPAEHVAHVRRDVDLKLPYTVR